MMFSGMSVEKTSRRRCSGVRAARRSRRSGSVSTRSGSGSGLRALGGGGRTSSSGSGGVCTPPVGERNSSRWRVGSGSRRGSAAWRCGSAVWRGSAGFCCGTPSPCSPSSSVLRKRAASGPSRMLARLPLAIAENLLSQLAVAVRSLAVWVVLEHGHSLHGGLCEAHRLRYARGEDPIAEVLLEQFDRLLRMNGTRVDERGQNALDLNVRVEVLPDHGQRVLKLDQATHGQILALHGDDNFVGGRQLVDREQTERRRSVDADEVVVVLDLTQRLLERALAADLRRHRDLGAGEVDRGAGNVDLALADHLADRRVVHE